MSKPTSLRVSAETSDQFNRLRVRIAVDRNNRIPVASDIISALLTVSENHYSELLSALSRSEGNSDE